MTRTFEAPRTRGGPPRLFAVSPFALVCVLSLSPSEARGDDMESDAVYLPAMRASSLAVRNPLGTVKLQGWDRPLVRIIAHKRAGSPSLLERLKVRADPDGADVRVTTGFYLSDGAFMPLPLQGAAIDLIIDAPRAMALTALTFTGDIDASGFRAGAHLSSQGGQIRASDVEGRVDTRTLNGNQWLEEIRGSLAASGVVGDLELARVEGERVDANVYRGQIIAREVTSAVVRLRSAFGDIVFVGALRPAGRYDFATREGDVRLTLRPAPFTLVARSPSGHQSIKSGFALAELEAQPGVRRARCLCGGPGTASAAAASLTLAAARGEISLQPAP